MTESIQWLVCGLLGAGALLWLARHFGLFRLRTVKNGKATGACGGCAHCDVAQIAASGDISRRKSTVDSLN